VALHKEENRHRFFPIRFNYPGFGLNQPFSGKIVRFDWLFASKDRLLEFAPKKTF
jgi:hypothetical protein